MPRWLRPHSFQGPLLMIHDALALYLSIGVVHQLRLGHWVQGFDLSLAVVIGVVLTALYIANTFHFARPGGATRLAVRTFLAVSVGGALMAAFVYVTKATTATTVLWRGNLPLSIFLFALWATVVRYLGSALKSRIARQPQYLILGGGPSVATLLQDYRYSTLPGVLKTVSGDASALDQMDIECNGYAVRVTTTDGEWSAAPCSGLVLATPEQIPERLTSQLMRARLAGIPVMELSDFYEHTLLRVPVRELKDRWFAFSRGFSLLHRDIELKIKRILDVLIAGLGLALASPLLLLLAVLVRATSEGPALYNQTRCGVHGREFRLHKFRTMVKDAERQGAQWSQPGDPRITKIGGFLRKSRLDELPQLWNVLVGEMSFIGPRPERPDFVRNLEQQIPYYELRHLIKPGITGWAQVMYPYGSSAEDARNKLEFDLYYIKNYSLALDLYILLRTIRVVVSRAGR